MIFIAFFFVAPAQVLGSAELPILADHVCKQSNVYGSAMSEGVYHLGFILIN